MPHTTTQPQDKFLEGVTLALLRRRMSITALAATLNRPRTSVSRAINRGLYPRLQRQISEELGL